MLEVHNKIAGTKEKHIAKRVRERERHTHTQKQGEREREKEKESSHEGILKGLSAPVRQNDRKKSNRQ